MMRTKPLREFVAERISFAGLGLSNEFSADSLAGQYKYQYYKDIPPSSFLEILLQARNEGVIETAFSTDEDQSSTAQTLWVAKDKRPSDAAVDMDASSPTT